MIKASALIALVGASALTFADGPGSRIRAGPEPPRPAGMERSPVDRDLLRCEALPEDQKRRCLRDLRSASREPLRSPHDGPGPESTGAGSSAGSGASTSGGGTFGAGAPR